MSIHKVNEIFIGAGAALSATNTALNAIAVQTGIVGPDMLSLDPAGTGMTISAKPVISIVNKLANGEFKRSLPIKGTSVTGWEGKHYVPSRKCVWTIGYQRGYLSNATIDGAPGSRTFVATGGSIEVNNSTFYSASIIFKNDKTFYSERPERLSIEFTSAAAATQLSIATQIANAVNNSGWGSSVSGVKEVIAVVIGDGTGAYGLTGATNYGVEITGLVINQFQNTQYAENLVYFDVEVNDATGFGATTCTKIQSVKYGTGTYNQVYNMENKFFGYEGVLNRTKWPIPVLAFLSSSTAILSGNVAAAATTPTGNVTTVSGEDVVTVATAVTGLRPGELIDINGVAYEIKYLRSATTFVITAAASASYGAAANIKVKYFYNILNINVTDTTLQDGAGVGQFSQKAIYIATPAIDSGAADPFDATLDSADTSAECLDLLDILNTWMTSTPLAPATVTLAQRY